jgi:trehalose/maltose hydrolase-like predicted phosphorylase
MIITKRLKKAVISPLWLEWMSIVEGFGGMRVKNTILLIFSKIPKQWKGYSFNFRNQIITVSITHFETTFQWTELKT